MLIHDLRAIGNRMFAFRKKLGLTQAEVAEAAGVADRTYADIERGTVNMRIETFLRICDVLRATPDALLCGERGLDGETQRALWERLEQCAGRDRKTAFMLLSVYLDSL